MRFSDIHHGFHDLMKGILNLTILACYILVGYGVPLSHARYLFPDYEIARKQRPPLKKNLSCKPHWVTVKHLGPTQDPTTTPDPNHLVPEEIKPAEEEQGELLDPLADPLTSCKSSLFREFRAPPLS